MKIKTTIETDNLFPVSGAKSPAHGQFMEALASELELSVKLLDERLQARLAVRVQES